MIGELDARTYRSRRTPATPTNPTRASVATKMTRTGADMVGAAGMHVTTKAGPASGGTAQVSSAKSFSWQRSRAVTTMVNLPLAVVPLVPSSVSSVWPGPPQMPSGPQSKS